MGRSQFILYLVIFFIGILFGCIMFESPHIKYMDRIDWLKSMSVPTFASEKILYRDVIYNPPFVNFSKSMGSIREFFDYILNPTIVCIHTKTMGGVHTRYGNLHYTDGDKKVCFDSIFNITENDCLVYSFGINNEWSFDDAFAMYGCKIFAFDPSMKADNFKRGKYIKFYPIGIGKENTMHPKFHKKIMKMSSIMKMLNHDDNDTKIDYLKMDVEGAEIDFFMDILFNHPHILDKFKQIGLEIHMGQYSIYTVHTYKKYYKIFIKLEERGFGLMFSNPNPVPVNFYYLPELKMTVNGYYELVWAKVR